MRTFGDRLHLRLKDAQAEAVIERLRTAIPQAAAKFIDAASIPPALEDVFIALADERGLNMDQPVIQVENLTRRFGDFVAVDHVSFDVQPGEIVGYLGPNGSGKTTTIRMLLGLLRPSEGSATRAGLSMSSASRSRSARACGYMSQKFAIYDDLTVWENLVLCRGVWHPDKASIAEDARAWWV